MALVTSRFTGSPAATMPGLPCTPRMHLQKHPDLLGRMPHPPHPPPTKHTSLQIPPHTRGLAAPHTAGCTVSTSRSGQVCSSCCLRPNTRPQTCGGDSPPHCMAHLQEHPGLQLLLPGTVAVVQLLVIFAPSCQVAVSRLAAGLAARARTGGALLGFRGGRAHLVRGDLPTHCVSIGDSFVQHSRT